MRFLHFLRCNREPIFINPKSEKNAFYHGKIPCFFFIAARLPPLILKYEHRKRNSRDWGKIPHLHIRDAKVGEKYPSANIPIYAGIIPNLLEQQLSQQFFYSFFHSNFLE